MGFDLEKIYFPSVGVDIVFNMNSLTPYSRSSIIYDIDVKSETIIIAQPNISFTKKTRYDELHLTTIIQQKDRKVRVGLECIGLKIIDSYPLANKTNVSAIRVKYRLPIKETNIRSAFRLGLDTKYIIKGKILYDKLEYHTSRDFSIRDISLAGLGLIVPKKRDSAVNPLSTMKTGTKIVVGLILINMDEDKPSGTVPIKAEVMRVNPSYSETHALVGLKTIKLESSKEDILNQFIHAAQIDALKKRSRLDL